MVYKQKGKENYAGLQKRLEHSLPAWYPTYNHPLVCKLVQKKVYRWSEHLIFQVLVGDVLIRKILVKIPNTHSDRNRQQEIDISPDDRVRLEYEALTSLYTYLDGEKKNNIVAVRPLAHFSDMDALVLEYWPGKNFLSILKRAGAFFGKFSNQNVAIQAAFDAGRLLAYLHQIPHGSFPKNKPLDVFLIKSSLDRKEEKLLTLHSSLLIEKQTLKIKKLITDYFGSAKVEVVITKLHGDYYPENIVLLPDGGVFTIDTPLYLSGSIEQDIVKFLVGTEITKRQLLYGSIGMDKTVADKVSQSFLKGYQSVGKFDRQVLLVFQFLGILQRWIEVLEVMGNHLPDKINSILGKARIMPFMLENLESLQREMEVEMYARE